MTDQDRFSPLDQTGTQLARGAALQRLVVSALVVVCICVGIGIDRVVLESPVVGAQDGASLAN